MSESGVIPRPEEREPSLVGSMVDTDGVPVAFWLAVDGCVRITIGLNPQRVAHLDAAKREEFSRLYFEAARQAEASDG